MTVSAVPPVLTYRGYLGSWKYLPIFRELSALGAGLDPFGYVLYDGTIAAQDTDRNSVSEFDGDCWLTHFTASARATVTEGAAQFIIAGRFTLELFDNGRQELLQFAPANGENCVGTAQNPFYLKHIYKLPPAEQLAVRVINLTPWPNAIQIVGWGLRK